MKANKFLILIVGVLLFTTGGVSFAQPDYKVAEQDSLALVAFYHATDGPNWTSNQDGFGMDNLTSEWQGVYTGGFNKWLDGPVKDWFGVTVEKRSNPNSSDSSYRVVQLWPVVGRRTDGQNLLSGYIPKEIGLLTALEDFRINGNNGFAGTEIPDDLYHGSLEMIDVEAANLDGDVSDALRNCKSLKMPNFRYNSFDYFPSVDFLDKAALDNMVSSFFLYNTEIPLSNFERIIDHFYSISENPKEYGIQMRDVNNVGDSLEVVASLGTPVDLECVFAGEKEEFITYQWYKDGLSKYGKTKRIYSIANVSESDYGEYTVKITNDYVKAYDGNSNWGEVYTKKIHLVASPVAPVVQWAKTSYNGKELHLRFSKPMPDNVSGYADFTVSVDGNNASVIATRTEGRLNRDVFLVLDTPINTGANVSLDYSGSSLKDKNEGILEAFTDVSVENMVRTAPAFVEARTKKDGKGIEIVFDNFIDESSINISDFSVVGNNAYSITNGTVQKGDIDEDISKTILLSVSPTISDSLEIINVSYTKGGLSGLYSGVAETFTDKDVQNEVILNFTPVTLYFEDGSKSMNNIWVQGSWGLTPDRLFDDGTNGDAVAGDNLWTAQFNLVEDNYTWNVIEREVIQSYDTASVIDPETGIITQTITPVEINMDSVISLNKILAFQVIDETVTGTTSFGINNTDVTFNVTAENVTDQIYLMGIENDWLDGILAEQIGSTNTYTVTLSGYTAGDLINYNYRDGDHWENQTAETRSYTVVDGENIVNDNFMTLSGLNSFTNSDIKIFPNPARNYVTINGLPEFSQLAIYNISGQLVHKQTVYKNSILLDISQLNSGIYQLTISNNALNISKTIIKTN